MKSKTTFRRGNVTQPIVWWSALTCSAAAPRAMAQRAATEHYVDARTGGDANSGTNPQMRLKTQSKYEACGRGQDFFAANRGKCRVIDRGAVQSSECGAQ